MNENTMTLINEDGSEELAEIIFTHEANGKNYVVFEFVESGDISAAIYEELSDEEGRLVDIETEEEWDMIQKLLDEQLGEDEEDFEDED